ncbi:hypothetical protein C8R43DRAFT_866511, partial [Mycena crocata]
ESDSKYAIESATRFRAKREDQGYIGTSNKELAQAQIARLRQRRGNTKFKWVKAHNGNIRNEGADKLAGEGARKPFGHHIDLSIPPELKLTGAKLSEMTQSLAYKAIRSKKMKNSFKKRRRAEINIERTKAEVDATYQKLPTEARLWKSIENCDFSREIRTFMWKTMHDAFMVGDKWKRDKNPEKQEWSEYKYCNVPESMEHIL